MHAECWSITGGGFHFGVHGLGQEETSPTLASDSLLAALIHRLAALEGSQAAEELTRRFLDSRPPFVLTSTFPLAGGVKFFPVLLAAQRPAGHRQDVAAPLKQLKKVNFVSESLFRKLLQGASLAGLYDEQLTLQRGAALLEAAEIDRLPEGMRLPDSLVWKIVQQPRVLVERASNRPNLYFTGRVDFAAGCGLWFGLRWLDGSPETRRRVTELLTELGAAGLGGERSAGYGGAQIRPGAALELPDPTGQPWVTLSRYLPRRDEIEALEDPRAAYKLKRVGGWLHSQVDAGQRRRPVRFLVEGSVLGPLEQSLIGQAVDVRPLYKAGEQLLDPLGHSVLRSGFAFAVGLEGDQP